MSRTGEDFEFEYSLTPLTIPSYQLVLEEGQQSCAWVGAGGLWRTMISFIGQSEMQ
jgi:hypothetical protein